MVLANFQALQSARRRQLLKSQIDSGSAALDNAAPGSSSGAGRARRHDSESTVQAPVEQASRATNKAPNGISGSGGQARIRALQRLKMVGGSAGLAAVLEGRDRRQKPLPTGPYALAPHVPKPLQWLVRGDKEPTEAEAAAEPVQYVLYPPPQQAMSSINGIAGLPPRPPLPPLPPLPPPLRLHHGQQQTDDDAFSLDGSYSSLDEFFARNFAEVSYRAWCTRKRLHVQRRP